MNYYELMVLINPNRTADEVKAIQAECEMIVKNNNGEISRFENWGCKQLAYPIKKNTKGYYLLFNFKCCKKSILELKELFRVNDNILRNLIIKTDIEITENTKFSPDKVYPTKDMKIVEKSDNGGYSKKMDFGVESDLASAKEEIN